MTTESLPNSAHAMHDDTSDTNGLHFPVHILQLKQLAALSDWQKVHLWDYSIFYRPVYIYMSLIRKKMQTNVVYEGVKKFRV